LQQVLDKIEHVVVKLTPLVMLLLALLIAAQFTLHDPKYEIYIEILDILIICYFAVDLTFKYVHTRSTLRFVKLYWFEMLAVFPFHLVISSFTTIAESAGSVQMFAHEAALAREAEMLSREAKILQEARAVQGFEALAREAPLYSRVLRFFQNAARLVISRFQISYHAVKHHSAHVMHREKQKKLKALALKQ